MPSQGRHRRKPRGNKGQDDGQHLMSRGDDSHSSESYSRFHSNSHHSDSYRTTISNRRDSYDMVREPSTSRTAHEQDSWRSEPSEDRYNYHASYNRGGGREEYNLGDTRDSGWSGRRRNESQYTQQREEWPARHDRGYSSSYQESPAVWDPPPEPSYDDRAAPYPRWTEEDHAAQQHIDRDIERGFRQREVEDRDVRWHREDRREREPDRVSDMGWEPRHRQSGRRVWEERDSWDRPPSPAPERSWEPAESWKSSHRDESHNHRHHHHPQKHNGHGKQHKGNQKKHYNHNKSKKDWRNDDSHLNNWQRRDNYTSERNEKFSSRKKHARARSRSRSRSPAESHYSHRSHHSHYSSRDRSRSRSSSPAPKRLRRESSPFIPHDESPRRGRRDDYKDRHSVSPASQHSHRNRKARRKSVSSVSTVSSERSRSQSPFDKPRAVHRLPTASASTGTFSRSEQRPKKGNRGNGARRKSSITAAPSVEQMPPPPVPHLSSRPEYEQHPTSNSYSSSVAVDVIPSGSRVASGKAGFKPIGQAASSSLKRFFPGDDDDMDISADSSSSNHIQEHRYEESMVEVEYRGRDEYDPPNPAHSQHPARTAHNQHPGHIHHPTHGQQPTNDPRHRYPNGTSWSTHVPETRYDEWDPVPLDSWEYHNPARPQNPLELDSPDPVTTVAMPPTPVAQSEVYVIVSQVGEGTFGKVYKARNTVTGAHVALKRIRMEAEKEGFPVTAMREIKLLQSLRHNNVVRLHEMMVSSGSVYMVFEYMDHDLTGILSQTQFMFSKAHLKSLCHQMLAGLGYLHHKGVIHRDIKGSNILINNRGELKLGDFGLARFYQKRRRADYTNRVITLWYRPPELLFGATIYGPEVDMWSAGCIMLELFTKKPVFQGNDEISQLDVIYRIIGTPDRERWAEVANLPWYELVRPKDIVPNHFRELFQKWMSPAALDLAERLLEYDPSRRINAIDAMQAPYFTTEEPPAEKPVGLATLEGEWHELETKRERAKKRKKE
ncbi:protein kinase [Moniliophthora roreri MCA 2997]|uniref:[RNA-polymerase]-subunit kinase n=2 Tax=Moniliophthora roreri TaxID=221103 RepID=V2YWG1_MONRO|nr:protein kinase [Moniliophthora roreri MCA 2997]KAI3612275.1 protein kinase [Moniliophthora roreri]